MKNVKKILIFKLCCLGDIVFLTPTISSLKKNFPEASFTFIHVPWVKNVVRYIKEIDNTIEIDLLEKKNISGKIFDTFKLISILRREKFDLVFTGHRSSLIGIILFLSGIKQRFGFRGTMFINRSGDFDKSIKETRRYLNILKRNNLEISTEYTHLERPSNASEIRSKMNVSSDDFILGIFPFGGINPGTEMDIKRWGEKNYMALISLIKMNHPEIKIILFEGQQESEVWSYEKDPRKYSVIKIHPEKISVCSMFICGDTGPLHVAAAFGISTLSIFGPSSPEHLAPESDPDTGAINSSIWTKPECSPCYNPDTVLDKKNKKYWFGNNFICNTGDHRCIRDISVDYVYGHFVEILNKLKKN